VKLFVAAALSAEFDLWWILGVAVDCRANSHQRDYLPVAGLPELCDDIAAWGTDRLHIDYSRDDVLVGPGTKELLFVLQTVYYGDLLLPNPSCTSFAPQAAIAGRWVRVALPFA
jgi:aspartate aminotransferase